MRTHVGAVAIIILLATGGAARQQPEPAGEPAQLEAAEVLVDAVVLDRDKRPVLGLTAADFEVLEDGQPQPVTAVRAATGRAADPKAAAAEPGPAAYHTFVVTDGTVQDVNLVDVRAALERYVREVMTESDYVTLFTIGTGGLRLLLPTTNDKAALLAAIAKAKDGGLGTLREAQRAGIDLARVQLPDDTYATRVVIGEEEGTPVAPGDPAAPSLPPDAREVSLRLARSAIERAEELNALGTSRTVYDALAALVDAHRVLPGRRSVTIFSEGFEQSRQVEIEKEKVLAAAAATGVTLNVVDARGLAVDSDRGATSRSGVDRTQNAARIRGSDLKSERTSSVGGGIFDSIPRNASTRTDILAEFAARTGGLFMRNSNDLFSGLEEIDRDSRNYYLIYYGPRRPWEAVEYRKIQVRVRNRPELTVRARDGYFAVPVEAHGLFRLEDQRLYVRAHRGGGGALKLAFRAYAFGASEGGTRVSYALRLPAEAVGLREAKGRFEGSFYGIVIARDARDRVLAVERIPIALDLSADEARLVRAEGVRKEGGFDVPGGEVAKVEAIVASDDLVRIGSTGHALRGLDWSSGPAVSDLVLGRAVLPAEAAGEPSFQAAGKYLVPLAAPVFRRGESITVLATAYWPAGRAMQPPVLSVWQQGKRLASLTLELSAAPGASNGWVFAALPTADIPPGEYLLRLNVRDVQGRSSIREAAFSVE